MKSFKKLVIWLIKIFLILIKNITFSIFEFFLFKIFFNIKIFDINKIRDLKLKKCIICCNHNHLLDACLLYIIFYKNNNLKILAKEELFNNVILKNILLSFNVIPINRDQININTLRHCIESLNSNYNIIIFPEGTRNSQNKKIKSGIGFFAYKTNANILPIYISLIKNKFRSNIHIYIGNIFNVKKIKSVQESKNKHEIYHLISKYSIEEIYKLEKNYCS